MAQNGPIVDHIRLQQLYGRIGAGVGGDVPKPGFDGLLNVCAAQLFRPGGRGKGDQREQQRTGAPV